MKRYQLPGLLFDYDALEPALSGEIMELHHDRHHRAYVDGANRALDELAEARARGDYRRAAAIEEQLAFNVSGHLLHSIFWMNLSPHGGGRPRGAVAQAIDGDLGGFASFREELTSAAETVMGSGWGALAWDSLGHRLVVMQIHDHQSQVLQGATPLLVVDAWEHAYYLQYRADRARYLAALWDLWSWDDVAARFAQVRNVDLGVDYLLDGDTPDLVGH